MHRGVDESDLYFSVQAPQNSWLSIRETQRKRIPDLVKLREDRFSKYASFMSSVRSKHKGDESNCSGIHVLGSRLALMDSEIPLSWGPMIFDSAINIRLNS